jgi:hypothetical protein
VDRGTVGWLVFVGFVFGMLAGMWWAVIWIV